MSKPPYIDFLDSGRERRTVLLSLFALYMYVFVDTEREQLPGVVPLLQETVTRAQALYRGFSVRHFLKESAASVGETNAGLAVVLPEGVRPILPGISRDKKAAAARARRDCAFRRRWEREAAISKMIHLEEESTRYDVV